MFSGVWLKNVLIMKLTLLLLCVNVFVAVGNSYSQQTKFSLSGKDVRLEDVFNEIKAKSEFRFFYNHNLVDVERKVNYDVENGTVSEVLDQVLGDAGIKYQIVDKTIVLSPKEKVLQKPMELPTEQPQKKKVSGKIVDETGQPIPGANIIVKGNSERGTVSDFNGDFTLEVLEEDEVLVVSFVGMEDQEVIIGSEFLNVTLKDGLAIDEVVVTALGLQRSTKSLGYAISNVKGDEIVKSSESNVVNALAGKVAGLDISSSSGGVGSSSRIILRGIKTTGSNSDQPLFVVDGVPVNNSLRSTWNVDWGNSIADFDPNDIAEVTVLKSAAAAALYGSAGANGVIVIKTKSGLGQNKLNVELSANVTLSEPFRLMDYQNEYGPGWAQDQDYDYSQMSGDPSWGRPFGVQEEAIQWNSPLDEEGNFVPLPLRAYPDNVKDFFDTGVTEEYSLAIAKSEPDKYHFRVGLKNTIEKGMVPTTEIKRNTISINSGAQMTKDVKVNFIFNYSNQDSPNRTSTDINPIREVMLMPRHVDSKAARNYEELVANGVPLPYEITGRESDKLIKAPYVSAIHGDYWTSPFYVLDNLKNEYSNDRVLAIFNPSYNITDWLRLDAKISSEIISEKIERKANVGVRRWTGSIYSYNGFYYRDILKRKNFFANAILSANKNFENFGFSSFVGVETRNNKLDGGSVDVQELNLPNFFNVNNGVDNPNLRQYYSESEVNSVFGSVDLDYKNLVYLTLTGRNDWNSTLPASDLSFFYPSASLSLIVSDMFTMPEVISLLKIRGNVGKVGIGTYPYQIAPTLSTFNRLEGVFEATVSDYLNNPDLKPTETSTVELGADVRLFDNRLNFDVAVYKGESKNQIQRVNLPGSTGYYSRIINAGDIANEGIELTVNGTLIDRGDFTWDMGATYSVNRNEVVSLAEGVDELLIAQKYSGIRSIAKPGEPYGQLMGTGYKRDPEGNIIHFNGIPVQTEQQIVLGNVTPDWIGSLSTSIRYKFVSLSAQVNAKVGGEIFSLTNAWAVGAGVTKNTVTEFRGKSMVGEGVIEVINGDEVTYAPNNVSVPYIAYVRDGVGRWGFHEPMVFDGTYVKLKNVRLAIDIPKKALQRVLPLSSAQISVTGRNLALLYTKVPNIDPESAASANNYDLGFDMFNLPTARRLTFGLLVKF